jgi:Flp pilus assembly protein CpaB
MEMEYRDNSRRGKWIIAFGVILALVAGGAAFYLINQAQQQAGGSQAKAPVVVAVRTIPARKPIESGDVTVREVPIDDTNANGVVTTVDKVIGKVPVVTILEGQLVTTNLLGSAAGTGTQAFQILGPEETVSPSSPAWRAVSITVPDDRAVGGLIQPNQTVDVFITATVNVPQDVILKGRYYTDKSTKLTYQDMLVLARTGTSYILKTTLAVAEEISQLQASGTATFSLALRPDEDTRLLDASTLGETTNRIIQRYGLPIPENYPSGNGPFITPQPIPNPTPSTAPGTAPSPSP